MTSVTSVGFGNIAAETSAEMIYCIFIMLFGGRNVVCLKIQSLSLVNSFDRTVQKNNVYLLFSNISMYVVGFAFQQIRNKNYVPSFNKIMYVLKSLQLNKCLKLLIRKRNLYCCYIHFHLITFV